MGPSDKITVVNLGATHSFVPSNPRVAVGWRERRDITVDLTDIFAARGISLRPEGGGIAFVAQPQIPPRNVNWSAQGKWVHAAKVGCERYFLHKVRTGKSETFYENMALDLLGIKKLKDMQFDTAQ